MSGPASKCLFVFFAILLSTISVAGQKQARGEEKSTNDDDHFDASNVIAQPPPANKGTFDGPTWIYLKGGARVEADSASQSPEGVWYKRGGMSIFIDAVRIDRVELEDTATAAASSAKKDRGWSTG